MTRPHPPTTVDVAVALRAARPDLAQIVVTGPVIAEGGGRYRCDVVAQFGPALDQRRVSVVLGGDGGWVEE